MKIFSLVLFMATHGSYIGAATIFDTYEYVQKGKKHDLTAKLPYYTFYKDVKNDQLTLVYFKNQNGEPVFRGFWISKPFAKKLPMPVVRYIGEQITSKKLAKTKSLKEAIESTKKAIEIALDPKWLNSLKNDSEAFSAGTLYRREYASFDMNYYEFFMLEKHGLNNPSELNDTIVLKVYGDSILKPHKVILEKNKVLSEVKDNLLKKPDFDKNDKNQIKRYNNLMDVIMQLGSLGYHHNSLKVSDWPLASEKNFELFSTAPIGFHTAADTTCKYLMVQQTSIKKSQLMPTMAWKQNYGNWKPTRCNMFAGDFCQEVLNLATYPWGSKDLNADGIHYNLKTNEDFVPITWDKAWVYANLGYPVFITTPKVGPAGHIAIVFPVDDNVCNRITDPATALTLGKVVQAGGTNGLMTVNAGFSFSESEFKNKATVYVYLGYLGI
jgi:hypothetical protein